MGNERLFTLGTWLIIVAGLLALAFLYSPFAALLGAGLVFNGYQEGKRQQILKRNRELMAMIEKPIVIERPMGIHGRSPFDI